MKSRTDAVPNSLFCVGWLALAVVGASRNEAIFAIIAGACSVVFGAQAISEWMNIKNTRA